MNAGVKFRLAAALAVSGLLFVGCTSGESINLSDPSGMDEVTGQSMEAGSDDGSQTQGESADSTTPRQVEEPQSLTPLEPSQLALGDVSVEQLEVINDGPISLRFEQREITEPGDQGFPGAGSEWTVSPPSCEMAIVTQGQLPPAVIDALDVRGYFNMTALNDATKSNTFNEFIVWGSNAFLVDPVALENLFNTMDDVLPGCAGVTYQTGPDQDPTSLESLPNRSGKAFVDTGQEDFLAITEPIGAVLYHASIGTVGPGALERGVDLYNEVADAFAQAQGIERDPILVDTRESSSQTDSNEALPPGITQEFVDAVLGTLESDLATSCSNFTTFSDGYVESLAGAASDSGGSRADWKRLISEWLEDNC